MFNLNKTLALILLGMILGGAAVKYSRVEHLRKIASLSKSNPLPSSFQLGKHLSSIKIQLQALTPIPESGNDEVTLKGTILHTLGSRKSLHFKWSLPENVQLIEGLAEDDLFDLESNKPVDVTIKVKSFDKTEKKAIYLEATHVSSEGVKLGNSASVNTRPEDSMEYIAPQMAEQAIELDTAPRLKGKILK